MLTIRQANTGRFCCTTHCYSSTLTARRMKMTCDPGGLRRQAPRMDLRWTDAGKWIVGFRSRRCVTSTC